MAERAKVLALIPARGGSKGISRKNIRDIGGIPLVGYSIRVALQSKYIDRVVVSTDSDEIAEVSREYGADVPFLRPQSLAGDSSLIGSVVHHALKELRVQGYRPDVVVTLYPTHPFRSVQLVDELIAKVLDGYSPVSTVRRITHNRFTACLRSENGMLQPVVDPLDDGTGERYYHRPYGLFSAMNLTSVHNPYIKVVDDPVALIDIDDMADLLLARLVVKDGMYDCGGI